MNTRRVELPHFNVLNREARAQSHTNSVTCTDVRIGSRRINPSGTASGKHRRFRLHVDRFTIFDINRNDTDHGTVFVLHNVNRVPFVQKSGFTLQIPLI